MDKMVVVIGMCAFLWLMLLQVAFTGLIAYDSQFADTVDEYTVPSSGTSLFTQMNSVLMFMMLFLSLGLLHSRIKKRHHRI